MCPSTRTGPDTPALYLRALIETCPIAIVVLDAQHHYTMCNPSFERLFQYTPNELASANLDSLIAGPERLEEAFGLSPEGAAREQGPCSGTAAATGTA